MLKEVFLTGTIRKICRLVKRIGNLISGLNGLKSPAHFHIRKALD